MQGQLKKMDVNITEAALLFDLLDSEGTGSIGYAEFVGGCMRLRKAAKSIDVITVMHEMGELTNTVEGFVQRVDQQLSKLDSLENHIRKDHVKKEADATSRQEAQKFSNALAGIADRVDRNLSKLDALEDHMKKERPK